MSEVANEVPAELQVPPPEATPEAPKKDKYGRKFNPPPAPPPSTAPPLTDLAKIRNGRKAGEDEEVKKMAEKFNKQMKDMPQALRKRVVGLLKVEFRK